MLIGRQLGRIEQAICTKLTGVRSATLTFTNTAGDW